MNSETSPLDVIEGQLSRFFEETPQLAICRAGRQIEIRSTPASELLLSLESENDRLTAWTKEWHGHFEETERAFEAVLFLLGGFARAFREYKGDTLTASWAEYYDGTAWRRANVSFMLNPLRADLWRLQAGESWTRKIVHIRVVDIGNWFRQNYPNAVLEENGFPSGARPGVTSRSAVRACIEDLDVGYAWYESRFGPPEQGMSWVQVAHHRLVYQVPCGWVDQAPEPGSHFAVSRRENSHAVLSVGAQVRDTEGAGPRFRAEGPTRPDKVLCTEQSQDHEGARWTTVQWTAIFSNGEEDMLAYVVLQFPESESADPSLAQERAKIGETLKRAAFVPAGTCDGL